MNHAALSDTLEHTLGARPLRLTPLQGGASGGVYRADLAGGEAVVAKVGPTTGSSAASALAIEGRMLGHLADSTGLPVPKVLHSTPGLLVMEHVENDGARSHAGEEEAAEYVAALHGITGPAFGFHWDTVLGGLLQPNPWTPSWADFFAEQRLLPMAKSCVAAGRMPADTLRRVEHVCLRLAEWFPGSSSPSLVHGDLWGGNVLWNRGRVAAFIDPAIHFADPEVEIAFTTLFNTFGEAFHRRYQEIRPLRPGFAEARKDLLNLYPLLVHVRLFGGGYLASVERILRRLA